MRFTYPAARRADTVDDYHGTLVSDPYRWTEDPDDPETQEFVRSQEKWEHPRYWAAWVLWGLPQ